MQSPQIESDPESATAVRAAEILVVIPTLNEEAHIETCLRSLMQGQPVLRDIPVIIADGGSTDDTLEIAEQLQSAFKNLRVVHNPKRLQSAAVNLAAETGATNQTRFLVRCDAHSIYPENFIVDVIAALKRVDAASLVVPMDAQGSTCFEKANAWIVDTPLGSGGAAHRGGRRSGYVDHGHHAGFRLDAFRAVGGYDETFSHNEDAELDHRLTASGHRIYLNADIRISYIPRSNLVALVRQYFRYGKGRARNVSKHGQQLKLRQALPILVLFACVIGAGVAPLFAPAMLLPLGYLGLLVAASVWMAIIKRSLCGLWCGVISGAMHMSWAIGFLVQRARGASGSPR